MQGSPNIPSLPDLIQLLDQLGQQQTEQQESLEELFPGKAWQVVAPCNKNSQGEPLIIQRQIAEADFRAAILDRLDALMDAYAEAWAWRRPLCKGAPPSENTATVTITAYSVSQVPPNE